MKTRVTRSAGSDAKRRLRAAERRIARLELRGDAHNERLAGLRAAVGMLLRIQRSSARVICGELEHAAAALTSEARGQSQAAPLQVVGASPASSAGTREANPKRRPRA